MRKFVQVIFLILLAAVPVCAQFKPASLIGKIEPIYDDTVKDYAFDPATIKVGIDTQGKAISVDSNVNLLPNIVRAIAAARFTPAKQDGARVSSSAVITLGIRKPLDYFALIAERPYPGDFEGQFIFKEESDGWSLNARSAAELEKSLTENANSEKARSTLVAYAAGVDTRAAQLLQAQQISWLVRNIPGSRILGRPASMLFPSGRYENVDGFEQVRKLWLDQLSRNPSNPLVLGHASYFLRISDPETVEKILIPALPTMSGAATWLGEVYALASIGATRLDYQTGYPASAGKTLPNDGFGRHAREELSKLKDPRILLSAVRLITVAGRTLSSERSIPEGYVEYCESLLQRVRKFNEKTGLSCKTTFSDLNNPANTIKQGGLAKSPKPGYPSEARAQHLEDTLQFHALIGEDGKVKTLEFRKGLLVFYEPSVKAIEQWEYTPTLVNGESVETVTTITMGFNLPRKSDP